MKRLTRSMLDANWMKADPEAIIRWHHAHDYRFCCEKFYAQVDRDLAEWDYRRRMELDPQFAAHERRYENAIRRGLKRLDRIRAEIARRRAEEAAARRAGKEVR